MQVRPPLYRGKDVCTHEWVYGYYIDRVTGSVPIIITDATMDDKCDIDFDYCFVDRETVELVRPQNG